MNNFKKKHLIEKLRDQGHYEEAKRVEETDHDELDFTGGIYAGIAAAELMSDFSYSDSPASDFSSVGSTDFSGGGGNFGGGGSGGDF